MSEDSIKVSDDASGSNVALRGANETDDSSNAREITLVDWSTRIWSPTFASPTRTETAEDTAELGGDFTGLDAAVASNKLTVGDHNLLVCAVHVGVPSAVENPASGDRVAIVPFVLDGSNNVFGYLTPKSATPWAADETPIQYTTSSPSMVWYISPMLAWPLNGAGPYIGIGIYGDFDQGETDTLTVKVWADLVSGQAGSGFNDDEPSDFYGQYGYFFGGGG